MEGTAGKDPVDIRLEGGIRLGHKDLGHSRKGPAVAGSNPADRSPVAEGSPWEGPIGSSCSRHSGLGSLRKPPGEVEGCRRPGGRRASTS